MGAAETYDTFDSLHDCDGAKLDRLSARGAVDFEWDRKGDGARRRMAPGLKADPRGWESDGSAQRPAEPVGVYMRRALGVDRLAGTTGGAVCVHRLG